MKNHTMEGLTNEELEAKGFIKDLDNHVPIPRGVPSSWENISPIEI